MALDFPVPEDPHTARFAVETCVLWKRQDLTIREHPKDVLAGPFLHSVTSKHADASLGDMKLPFRSFQNSIRSDCDQSLSHHFGPIQFGVQIHRVRQCQGLQPQWQ